MRLQYFMPRRSKKKRVVLFCGAIGAIALFGGVMSNKIYYQSLLSLPIDEKKKVAAIRDWARQVSAEGHPHEVFELFPNGKPQAYNDISYIKITWGSSYYIWASRTEAGITEVPPDAWGEVIGTVGTWPTIDELREEPHRDRTSASGASEASSR